jgi:hypothetical protein
MAQLAGKPRKRGQLAKKSTMQANKVDDNRKAIIGCDHWLRGIWTHIDNCRKCTFIRDNALRTDLLRIDPKRNRHSGIEQKLNPKYFYAAIRIISDEEQVTPVMPTIDCFASHLTVQSDIVLFIDKKQNFFSARFSCRRFWYDNIAWAQPPHNSLMATVDAFARRCMCGYVCGPKGRWVQHAEKLTRVTQYDIGGRGLTDVYFPTTHGCNGGDGSTCPFDTVIVYMDFRVDPDLL